MPLQQTNIQKGKFSNYGSSIFVRPTNNTEYFKSWNEKQPTMRGAFPSPVRSSDVNDGFGHRRSNYERGINLASSPARSRRNSNYTQPEFDGNAAIQIEPEPEYVLEPEKSQPKMHAHAGRATQTNLIQSAALSPMFVSLAKVAVVVVCVIAILAFVRVGITSATVSTGISSQDISKQIDNELVTKNALEVQDSTLGNTGRIRQVAAEYALVAPATVESIVLDQDVLAYDENKNVSLVESLNRVAQKTQ